MRIISGFQDTRNNNEDYTITPYLFGVWYNGTIIQVFGLGLCWGWYSLFLGLGKNLPKDTPTFRTYK